MFLVFVYGTLKRGLSNSSYLAGQRFVAEAQTQSVYRMVDCGGYPGLYAVAANGLSIQGEVWEVTAECRARLDVLEDIAGGEYIRTLAHLLPPFADQPIELYLYLHDPSKLRDAGDHWTDLVTTPTGLATRSGQSP